MNAETVGGPDVPKKATLQRMAIITPTGEGYDKYTFRLNPESFSQDFTARATVQPTMSGIYVDHFGTGVGRISVSGSTGKGFLPELKRLKKAVLDFHDRLECGGTLPPMKFMNMTDAEYWAVVVQTVRVLRNIQSPILYRYEIDMAVLGPDVTPRKQGSALMAVGATACMQDVALMPAGPPPEPDIFNITTTNL